MDTAVTIAGNLTADAKLEQTSTGTRYATFTLAVTPRVFNNEKWESGTTSFYRCVVWRDQAAHAAKSLKKGDRVLATGELRVHPYTTESGEHRTSTEMHVDEMGPSLRWATAEVSKANHASSNGEEKHVRGERS